MFLRQSVKSSEPEYAVVKGSMLGSVLSNMLLVQGMSFLLGGLYYSEQRFNKLGTSVMVTMLLLSCLLLISLTVFASLNNSAGSGAPIDPHQMLTLSRVIAILMLVTYCGLMFFQLVSHRKQTDDAANSGEDQETGREASRDSLCAKLCGVQDPEATEGEEEDEASISGCWALVLLVTCTIMVSVCSENLTDALEGALHGSGISKNFLGVILLPIVGNACEHFAAIKFALQNKAGLAVGIAIGSSVQIATFVTPFSVLVGWILGDRVGDIPDEINMNLDLGALNVTVLTMSVLVVMAITIDGKSNWMEGFMLCTAYSVIALLYFFEPEQVKVMSVA